jgi:uncharacterized protein (DUF433 family)
MMISTTISHICLDEYGVAWIDDTNVKVVEVVLDKLAHGSSVEEMHFQLPHLSLAQIHAALAWYHDNQAEMDAEIRRRRQQVDEIARQQPESPFRLRLQESEEGR